MNAKLTGNKLTSDVILSIDDIQTEPSNNLKQYRNIFDQAPLTSFVDDSGNEVAVLVYDNRGDTIASPDKWELFIPSPLPAGDELKSWELAKDDSPALFGEIVEIKATATVYSKDGDHYEGKGENRTLTKAKVADPRRDYGTNYLEAFKNAVKVFYPDAPRESGNPKVAEARDKKPLIRRFTDKGFALPAGSESMSYDDLLDAYAVALITAQKK